MQFIYLHGPDTNSIIKVLNFIKSIKLSGCVLFVLCVACPRKNHACCLRVTVNRAFKSTYYTHENTDAGYIFRALRGASRRPSFCRPLRRTMRSSRLRSWTRPTPLAPRLIPLVLMRDFVTLPHVSPSSASPHLAHLILFVQELRPNLVDGAVGREKTPAAHSVPTTRATATWTKRRARPS
jgi:hypothetical protein